MLPLWVLSSEATSVLSILWVLGIIIVCGLLLNVYVVLRLTRLAKRDREQFLSGTGVYLNTMALSDIVSLIFIFSHLFLQIAAPYLHEDMLAVFCKGFVFMAHCAYTISMYCWLFMSGLRYLAAFHPLKYTTVWRSPFVALSIVGLVAVLVNLHVAVSVRSAPQIGCTVSIDTISQLYNLTDIVVSWVVPSAIILYMDLRVLCCRSHRRHSDPLLQVVFHKPDEESEKRRAANMKRFMVVTLVGLLLSLPELSLRAIRTISLSATVPAPVFLASKILYFLKFSFNAFYLTSYVFDRNILSKTSSSRQLSISVRRLEECPAITHRDRAYTLSYRATTPIPQLTRNSSCNALDVCESPRSPKMWL